MSFFRAISKGKWENNAITSDISADSVTGDLRTKENTLSVWKINNDTDIDNYCMITALNRDRISKVDYIVINEDELQDLGIETKPIKGLCKAFADETIKESHYDMVDINYDKLGKIAHLIINKVNDRQVITKTKKQLKHEIDNSTLVIREELPVDFF